MDGLRDAMTPEQMDGWIAYCQLEPFGDDWQKAGTIAAVVHNTVMSVAAAFGGGKMREIDLLEPAAFIPSAEPKKQHGRMTDAKEQEQFLKSMLRL